MTPFELARLRRPALIGEYLRWCAPESPGKGDKALNLFAINAGIERRSREWVVTAILTARENGGTRH